MFCFYHFRQTNAPLGLGTYRALFTHCKWLLNLPKSNEKLGRWHTTSSKSKKQYTKHSLQLRGNRGWSTRIFRRHNSSPHLWTLNESLFINKKKRHSLWSSADCSWFTEQKWKFKLNLKKIVVSLKSSPQKKPKHLFS